MVSHMKYYVDKKYDFFELFNPNNGTLIRSNIMNSNLDPRMRSFPELIDVGIMGNCIAGRKGVCVKAGIDCYQMGSIYSRNNMKIEDYQWILEQCKGKTFQVALGGAGDPNKHDSFEEILLLSKEYDIVPNLTTSGLQITDNEIRAIKKHCGAVAVSYYSRLKDGIESNYETIEAIERLVRAGCITNVHYVVSADTINEAIYRLEKDRWPYGINAVIFLLYKPVGLGTIEKTLECNDKVKEFLDIATNGKHSYSIGFDTCFTSGLCNTASIDMKSIDACEAARFSMYIDCELNAFPCSFGIEKKQYKVKLNPKTIQDAWDSAEFEAFRNNTRLECGGCKNEMLCAGGCNLNLGIELCDNLNT